MCMTINRYVMEIDAFPKRIDGFLKRPKKISLENLTDKEESEILEKVFTQGVNRIGYDEVFARE